MKYGISIISHVEGYLGEIARGWKDNSSEIGVKIVSFDNCPGETVTTYVSIGMGETALKTQSDKKWRQEFVLSVYSKFEAEVIVSFMMSVCESVLSRGRAVLRGDAIPLDEKLAGKIGFSAIYCAMPVFFEDGFCSFEETSPHAIIVWIIPIHNSEFEYICSNGWGDFEELLELNDPDLCSLWRKPVV